MEVSVKLRWRKELAFAAEIAKGRIVELNSSKEMGNAFSPMELFLVSLAGCTAMDVQWIMNRQRQQIDKFDLSIKGKRRDNDPRYYESIDLNYAIAGPNIKKTAVERAIRLSQQKYCSVHAMLKDNVKLNVSYTIDNGKGNPETCTYASSAPL
jgi:putative redox protein